MELGVSEGVRWEGGDTQGPQGLGTTWTRGGVRDSYSPGFGALKIKLG